MQGDDRDRNQQDRDLVLNPGEQLFIQDLTKGVVRTLVGPCVVNPTPQERAVIYENGGFRRAKDLPDAVRKCPVANEGQYIALINPAIDGSHPTVGRPTDLPDLKHGSKVNIHGPKTFALFPGQEAQVIDGHHLRSNQYLLVTVYQEEEARKNWSSAVMKKAQDAMAPAAAGTQKGANIPAENSGDEQTPVPAPVPAKTAEAKPVVLSLGLRLVIPGTDVSFYMPPTGVEAVPQDGEYVRDAVTLERLEYAVLVDENGSKRYERGPQVVFPKPTEEFQTDAEGNSRKFRARELNPIQGVHLKCIAACKDPTGKDRKEGEEFFLTGAECPIFYPQPELPVIKYGESMIHYAIAIPPGEGRYVMNRMKGVFRTETGPTMLLLNPVDDVMVRRILSDKECSLWYPGNADALAYNRSLRGVTGSDGTMTGCVSEEMLYASRTKGAGESVRGLSLSASNASYGAISETSGDFSRGTKFTKPRELILNTKYDGVPVIQVWTGYAVMIVSKSGKRRVVQGPQTVLLDYDETLEVLMVSTGKPKNMDAPIPIVYLRALNNKVSDIVQDILTSDHVGLDVKLSFRIDFTGDPMKWFSVENYVKLLCDHVRSVVKGVVRRKSVEEFYGNAAAIIRDTILGTVPEAKDAKDAPRQRPGMLFPENGMKVVDVEILEVAIKDAKVKQMLEQSQIDAVQGNIQLAKAQKDLSLARQMEDITRQRMAESQKTTLAGVDNQIAKADKDGALAAKQASIALAAQVESKKLAESREQVEDMRAASELKRKQAVDEHKLTVTEAEAKIAAEMTAQQTAAIVERFKVFAPGLSEALLTLSNQQTLEKVAQAVSVQRLVGGEGIEEILKGVFAGTHMEESMRRVLEAAAGASAGRIASAPRRDEKV